MPDCTNCESDLSDVQSLYVQKDGYVDRSQIGEFCTYECLTEYIQTHKFE